MHAVYGNLNQTVNIYSKTGATSMRPRCDPARASNAYLRPTPMRPRCDLDATSALPRCDFGLKRGALENLYIHAQTVYTYISSCRCTEIRGFRGDSSSGQGFCHPFLRY